MTRDERMTMELAMSQDKLPSFQFYPGDWLKDPSLRAASPAARGLWIDMLCLMWEMQPRGYLQTATGAPLTVEQIARMAGICSSEEVRGLIGELESLGVFSRTSQGVIYSRRLVREERLRQIRREAGRKGGNPILVNQKSNQTPTTPVNQNSNQTPTPSSSSSSSRKENPPLSPHGHRTARIDWSRVNWPDGTDTPAMREAIVEWLDYRQASGKPYKRPEQQISLLLADYGTSLPAAIRHSIAQGYQGCFLPQKGGANGRSGDGRGYRHDPARPIEPI